MSRILSYPIISRVLGSILLTACALKVYQLATAPALADSIWTSRWFLIAVAEAELVLGLALLIGALPRATRLAAIVLFGIFAVVSLIRALEGRVSCGCLGKVDVNPWYVVAFDLAAVAALLSCRRPAALIRGSEPDAGFSLARLEGAALWGGLALLVLGVTVNAWFRPADDLFEFVSFDQSAVDFGEVPQSETLTQVFRLRNRWTQPIEIVRVHSTCGCTATDALVGQSIPAGHELAFPVTLKTGDSDGPRTGTITVFYRGPGQSVAAWKSVRVGATVVTDYWVRPLLVDFGAVDSLQPVTRTIRLRPNRLADIQITGLRSGDPAFTAREVLAPAGDNDRHVEVTFAPASLWRSGPLSATLHLATTSARVATTTVVLQAQTHAPVEVHPTAIVIGSDVGGDVTRHIRITARQPVRILAARSSNPAIVIRQSVSDAAKEHRIEVQLPEADNGTALDGEVQLQFETVTAAGATVRSATVPVHRLLGKERMVTP